MVARVVDTKENNNKSILFFFQTLKGKVKAGKVDCQAYAQTCQKAGIRAYPTVRLYPYERAKVCTCLPLCPFSLAGKAFLVSFLLSFLTVSHATETAAFHIHTK